MIGLSLVASVGSFVSHLFLVDVCSAFCTLDLIVGRFAGGQHVARVCTHCGDVAVADEMHMIFECPALHPLRQQYAPLCSTNTNTIKCFVLRNKITCNLSSLSQFDLCLHIHVIRLVGWLKLCDLSLQGLLGLRLSMYVCCI